MERVPVLIITLCRYEHFRRCIESLKSNALANETEIFIGLDYPLNDSHKPGYLKIKNYLKNEIDGFQKVHVLEQTKNLGADGNYKKVKEELYKYFDRYIFTEDDNEFSPNFLEYMNLTMNQYERDESVYAVSGYTYPIDLNDYHGTTFKLNYYFSAFGYGVWKEKEEKAYQEINMSHFYDSYRNQRNMRALKCVSKNQYCNFVKGMLQYIPELIGEDGEIQKIDLSFGLYMFFTNKNMIFPTVSKVRNWGYDGSGIHCGVSNQGTKEGNTYSTYSYEKQIIDTDISFQSITDQTKENAGWIQKKLNHFFGISIIEEIKTTTAYVLSIVFGMNTVKRILSKIKK